MDFKDLGLKEVTQLRLNKLGIKVPTPIQDKVIPVLLDGQDIIGQAQTGTGKTYAFVLPIIEKLQKNVPFIQTLILSPTRELAIQITNVIEKIKTPDINVIAVYGGQDVEKQLHQLKKNISIVVATPGRLIDHMKRGNIDISRLSYLVLDEADQMLHIGFQEEIRYIMKQAPVNRQTMLFSATISKEITMLAKKYTKNAQYISVEKKQGPALTIKQYSMHTTDRAKQATIMTLIQKHQPYMAVIFCRTKRRVSKLYEVLKSNDFECGELHGDLSQAKREQVMKDFRKGKFPLLIATDVAARGLDIEGITHVFNYDIPLDAESYVHRIGRTGRAGIEGFAITFYSSDDRPLLDSIENQLQISIEKLQAPKKAEEKPKVMDTNKRTGVGKKTRTPKKSSTASKEKKFASTKRTSNINEKHVLTKKSKNNTGSAIFKPKKSKKK